MKVLSYVIELFHVHQTVMLAWMAEQDVNWNPMDIYVPYKGLTISVGVMLLLSCLQQRTNTESGHSEATGPYMESLQWETWPAMHNKQVVAITPIRRPT